MSQKSEAPDASKYEATSPNSQTPTRCTDRHGEAGENIIRNVTKTIRKLIAQSDCLSGSTYDDIKYLWSLSRHTMENNLKAKVQKCLEKENFVQFLYRLWSTEKGDIFNPDVIYPWKNMRITLSVVWTCCDSSSDICGQVTQCGLIPEMLNSLQTLSMSKDYSSHERKQYFVKCLLGILHNCVRNYTNCHLVLLSSNAIEILRVYNNSSLSMIKAKSLIIISYLVNEEQTEAIIAGTDTLKFIVGILQDTLSSVDHFSSKYGMNTVEVLKGLNNIALNDKNKVTLVRCGMVTSLRGLLTSQVNTERLLAATGIWTLSFAKENKPILKSDSECIKALQDLVNSEEVSLGHAVRRALWEIHHDQMSPEPEVEVNTSHVMISYQWDAQDMMLKVKDKLTQAGYKVWMDVENMSGSTLEAMALAVEKSAVVLICMSEKYKSSPSCRTESEYVYRLRKDIIPLRVQPKFVPDGWLGLLVGSRLYFDISTSDLLDRQITRVIKELGSRGKIYSSNGCEISNGMCTSSGSSLLNSSLSQSVSCWTVNEVADWLAAVGLDHSKDRFSDLDGGMLTELKRIQKNAPEFFYSSLKSEMKLSFCDVLKFSRALSML